MIDYSMDKETKDKIGQWLTKVVRENGAIISQRDASCTVGINESSIKKAADKGAIRVFECEGVKRYSLNDCILYKSERERILQEHKLKVNDEKLKKSNPIEYIEEIHKRREKGIKYQEEQEIKNQEAYDKYIQNQEELRIPTQEEINDQNAENYYNQISQKENIEKVIKSIEELNEFIKEIPYLEVALKAKELRKKINNKDT